MKTGEAVQTLRAAGIEFFTDAGRLKYRVSRAAFTPDLQATLREHLPEIAYRFHERAAIVEFDGRLTRAEAEATALAELRTAAAGEK